MSPQATVRAQARRALKQNYVKALAAFAIALLPIYLVDCAVVVLMFTFRELISDSGTVDVLTNTVVLPLELIGGVLLSPFFNGFVRVFYRNATVGSMDLGDLYYYFEKERYSRALQLNLSYLLRMLLPIAIAFVPLFAYVYFCGSLSNGFAQSVFYDDFYFILCVMSTVIVTLYSLKYFTVFTLSIEDESLSARELFARSKQIMRGYSISAAKLVFGYTPWMLLCLTVLPIIYVVPYMTQGLCIGAMWITRAANEETT